MTLAEMKTVSEIISNVATPIATVATALIAVWGAKAVTDKVVEARGAGVTAQSQAPTGFATGGGTAPTSASSSPPQATVTVTPDK
jgi:hypothetical protein